MAGMLTSTNADRIPTLSDVVNGRHADFDICRRNAHLVRPFSLVGVWWENISRRRLFTGPFNSTTGILCGQISNLQKTNFTSDQIPQSTSFGLL